jgi:hypothetical protein
MLAYLAQSRGSQTGLFRLLNAARRFDLKVYKPARAWHYEQDQDDPRVQACNAAVLSRCQVLLVLTPNGAPPPPEMALSGSMPTVRSDGTEAVSVLVEAIRAILGGAA